MKILIIKLHALGDVFATSPLIRCIKQNNKNFEIHHMVDETCSPVTYKNPYLDMQIITNFLLSRKNFKTFEFITKNIYETIRIIKLLRKHKYKRAYILHRNFFFQILCRLGGVKEIYGFKSNHNYFLFQYSDYSFQINRTIQEYNLILDSGISLKKPKKLDFYNDNSKINKYLIDSLPSVFLTCNPGGGNSVSSAKNRKWSLENYIKVIQNLDYKVVVLGYGEEDEEISKELNDKNIDFINLINRTNIFETAEIISRSLLYFGNDSSLLFLAASMNKKTLGLFGPTQVKAANPIGNSQFFIKGNSFCSPCYNPYEGNNGMMYKCKNNLCMKSITTMEVLTKINEILKIN